MELCKVVSHAESGLLADLTNVLRRLRPRGTGRTRAGSRWT